MVEPTRTYVLRLPEADAGSAVTTRAPSRPRSYGRVGRPPAVTVGGRRRAGPTPATSPVAAAGQRTATEHRRLLAVLIVAVVAFGVVAYRVATVQVRRGPTPSSPSARTSATG